MSFIDKLTAHLPALKKQEQLEYFFALNIGPEVLAAALWTVEGHRLKIVSIASDNYSSQEQLVQITDKLLDRVVAENDAEPDKILFGVPDTWLQDEDLKEPYLKLLRQMVKELELSPMAYVATSHALTHLLEKQEGAPTTAILIGLDKDHLRVIVSRAGKIDGGRLIKRGDNIGSDVEKALLSFTDVEVLPSRILLFGSSELGLEKHKNQLLSFPWMAKLSFLHFPKIEVLEEGIEVQSISLAGAVEIDENVAVDKRSVSALSAVGALAKDASQLEEQPLDKSLESQSKTLSIGEEEKAAEDSDVGFVVGDVAENVDGQLEKEGAEAPTDSAVFSAEESNISPPNPFPGSVMGQQDKVVEQEDFGGGIKVERKSPLKYLASFGLLNHIRGRAAYLGIFFAVAFILIASFLFVPQAQVTVFVEPRILERDTQVTADPAIKEVNEEQKKIPGQAVSVEVNGTGKELATGKRQVGDPAKGVVVIRNKTDDAKTLPRGTTLTGPGGLKFDLDISVTIASSSATDGTWGRASAEITAKSIGPDSNLPSGTDLTVDGFPTSQFIAESEGNFSGGTSREVTVVSDADQKKLLASLASSLRKQAQEKLQAQLSDKKILEEALSEEIIKRSYSKNVNDQANDFSLNLTIRYKGTAFEDKDLKLIVSKLVSTNVPEDFELNLAETETQADVSKLEKDGRLIFLARFRAKLLPKIDTEEIRSQLKGKTPEQAAEILKAHENVLGSEIKITPSLPPPFQLLPLLDRNIKVEVGLK